MASSVRRTHSAHHHDSPFGVGVTKAGFVTSVPQPAHGWLSMVIGTEATQTPSGARPGSTQYGSWISGYDPKAGFWASGGPLGRWPEPCFCRILAVVKRLKWTGTITAAALIGAAILLQGCGANDDPFTVTIKNDTSAAIVDHSFFGAAYGTPGTSHNGQVITLTPGRSFAETEFANEGVDPDRVTSLSGKTLGCFPFQFSENAPTSVVVKVTQMVRCKNWVPESNLPRDWPNPNY